MTNIMRSRIDLTQLPPLSEEEKLALKRLSAVPNSEINLADMPELTDEFFQNAVKNPFYKPKKISTTIRLDADVLNWLKSQGKGYQTRINEILRTAMLNSLMR